MALRFNLTDPTSWEPAILHAQTGQFWILTLLLLGAGIACGYGIFHYIRRARIMEDTPTSRVRSAPQGYVEIIGAARYLTNQAMQAPLTKMDCAWYSFTIEKQETTHTSKGSSTTWRTVEKQISTRPFELVDETGSCLIDPRGAEVYEKHKDVWYGEEKWPIKGPQHKLGLFAARNYRYTEKRLHQDDPLYAIGEFRTLDPNKVHGTLTDEIRTVLNLWKQDQDDLLQRFDANGDARIDMQEWEQVRQAAEKQVHEQRLARASRPVINIMGKTGDFRRPYILSTHPQSSLAGRFKLKAAACLAGFVALFPVSLWMMYTRLGA